MKETIKKQSNDDNSTKGEQSFKLEYQEKQQQDMARQNRSKDQIKQKEQKTLEEEKKEKQQKEQRQEQQQIQKHYRQQQYVSEHLILISRDIICTVTKHNIDFYSIETTQHSQTQSKNNNGEFIGRISANKQLKYYLLSKTRDNNDHNSNSKTQLTGLQQQKQHNQNQQPQQHTFKQQNFIKEKSQQVEQIKQQCRKQSYQKQMQWVQIIEQKGVVYHTKTNTFFILLETNTNKYLVAFHLQINQSQVEKKHSNVEIMDFVIVYDFSHASSQVKYSLQLNPQILLLTRLETLVLIRKFYNDSFVVVFKKQTKTKTKANQIMQNYNKQHQLNSQDSLKGRQVTQNNQHHPKPPQQQIGYISPSIIYQKTWSFYINQQCLSSLDDGNYLVNYRQLITKNYMEIDIIDVENRQKAFVRIDEQIEPMTVKSVQMMRSWQSQRKKYPILSSQYIDNDNSNDNNNGNQYYQGVGMNSTTAQRQHQQYQSSQKGQLQTNKIRIFAILKRSQTSIIIDYDLIHQTVIKTYNLPNLFIEHISFKDYKKNIYFIQYIYHGRSYIGVMKEYDLIKLAESEQNHNNNKSVNNIVRSILDSSVEFQMNSFVWSLDLQLVVQSQISVKNNLLTIKCSKIINKNIHIAKIIDQLKNSYQILQSQQFSHLVYELLNRQN